MYDIEELSRTMIHEMINQQATDVHLVPSKEKYIVTYRYNGRLTPWKDLRPSIADRLISHLKYESGMDIGERRKPQSSSMIYYDQSSAYSLRLSTLPTLNQESLAIRILPHVTSKTLPTLTILQQSQKTLHEVSQLSSGLCLISGPTGSGKTTTLYAIVEQIIQQGGKSIITIEDPVERPIPTVVQVEVNQKAGLTFDAVLRASLRHDPDVLLIGEIRDEVTAALAIRASLTGHLVLATVHSTNCYTALLRMIDLGVSQMDLSECCRYVLSQRLVQTKCSICTDLHCHHREHLRTAIFDVLKGDSLTEAIVSRERKETYGLIAEAKKAWALGYIPDDEVLRLKNEY